MASNFDRWEKDPFFSAAEEVQQSADRMESTYRTWIHSLKDLSGLWNSKELRRDLHTALGTTKWQLEEFERAVNVTYTNSSVDDARDRHSEFSIAIKSQISRVENSLHESAVSEGKPPLPWVHLNEGERNELAAFLVGNPASSAITSVKSNPSDLRTGNPLVVEKHSILDCSKNSTHPMERSPFEVRQEKVPGHRRAASASADIGGWEIAVPNNAYPHSSSNVRHDAAPRKIPSLSGFLNTMDSATKFKWLNNGYRKLKLTDYNEEADSETSDIHYLNGEGSHVCYERNKSCLDGCDECYNKQLYGWYGAIQRQLQRSQYYMLYSRPVQVVLWTFLLFCLIVVFGFCAV